MLLIRRFEERLIDLCKQQGKLIGMQILANGQEAVAVGIVSALKPDDVIVTNHRSHGHLLARGADPGKLMAEIMGKATGYSKGKAGTLHLSVPEVNAPMTTTVVGAGPPMAIGAAFAQQYHSEDNITVVFFGDGSAAEGSVHEAMNLAALWKLPIIFVCENNCWAAAQGLLQHCSIQDISLRGRSYGMPGEPVDGNDVEKVYTVAIRMAADCREGKGPALIEAKTYRMRGHGETDHQHYVNKEEICHWAGLCPIRTYQETLLAKGLITEQGLQDIDGEIEAIIDRAVRFAEESPFPLPEEALQDVWVEDQ